MRFVKKNLAFVVFSVVAAALTAAAVYILAVSAREFEGEKRALGLAMNRWQQLHGRNPHPSMENVHRETENVEKLIQFHSALNEMLRRGQIEERDMEAAEFMTLLETALERMRSTLDAARVAFPRNYAFTFDRYAAGELPAPAGIPRLTQQLEIVETLCDILSNAGISMLLSISREVLETPEAAPRTGRTGRAGRPEQPGAAFPSRDPAAGDTPYTTQWFKVDFRAREHAALDVLNRLAGHSMFIVVRSVEMASAGGQAGPVARRMPGTEAAADAVSREQRAITGKEEMEVSLELEIYHFPSPAALR